MEPVPQEVRTGRVGREQSVLSPQYSVRRVIRWLPLVILLAFGCATTGDLLPGAGDVPTTGKVAQVSAAWNNQVLFAPDPAHGGSMAPGLAGRLYLFGPDMGWPLAGDGRVIVDLFDPSQTGPNGPKQLERWVIEQETLQRCLRKDAIGWGYTLLLPWGTYRADLTQVHLKVQYDPPKGAPIYAQPSTVVLNSGLDLRIKHSTQPLDSPTKNGG